MTTEQELNEKLGDRDSKGRFVNGHAVSESNKRAISAATKGRFADEARHWRNGRYKTSRGYIMIYKPDHPYATARSYVPEHRLIMEEALGRYLLPQEIVHHINAVNDDNRLGNLYLCSRGQHCNVHRNGKPVIPFRAIEQLIDKELTE